LATTNASRPAAERILPAALLLKATAREAAEVPTCNGTWVDGFRPADAVRIGVVVFLREGGFVVPTVADADQLALDDLMATLRDLVTGARAGRLRSSEVAGTTITVTNLGDRGAEEVHGVIHPPQVALVGFGRIVERPWATGGLLGVRPTVRATLAGDHRVNDGHDGSRFLSVVDRSLQLPEEL
jgi:pyruvate dehydrogenase E2 component (dihydrolipoamide acetyltransferase)